MTLTLMELVGKWHKYASADDVFTFPDEAFTDQSLAVTRCADELEALVREWDTQPVAWSLLVRREILGTLPKE